MNQIAGIRVDQSGHANRGVRDTRVAGADTFGVTLATRTRKHPRHKWTRDEFLALSQMRDGGASWDEIGARIGVSADAARCTIQRWSRETLPAPDGRRFPPCITHPLLQEMTPHWRRTLWLFIHGHQAKLVAYKMGISLRTVEGHRQQAFRVLKARNVADAVRISCLSSIYSELQQEFSL